MDIDGAVDITGVTTTKAVAVDGSVTVTAGTLTVGTTEVHQATTLNGDTAVNGTLTVGTGKATTLNGTLAVGTSATPRATTLNGDTTITGNTTLATVTVAADAQFDKAVTITGNLTGNGGTTILSGNVTLGSSSGGKNTIAIVGDVSSSGTMQVEGAATFADNVTGISFIANSDRTLKANIKPIDAEKALAAVTAMQPCQYEFKKNPGDARCGVIAQDLQQVVPALVKTTAAGTLAVDYNDMNAYLIGAIQALRTQMAKESASHRAEAKKSAAEAAALRAELAKKGIPSAALAELESVKHSVQEMRTAVMTLAEATPAGGGDAVLAVLRD